MTRTQVLIPDDLYARVKNYADKREGTLTELVRRGLEGLLDITSVPFVHSKEEWHSPDVHLKVWYDPTCHSGWHADLQDGIYDNPDLLNTPEGKAALKVCGGCDHCGPRKALDPLSEAQSNLWHLPAHAG